MKGLLKNSIVRIVRAYFRWAFFKLTSKEIKRLEICEDCSFMLNNTCDVCGCPIKAKIRDYQDSCPMGKW